MVIWLSAYDTKDRMLDTIDPAASQNRLSLTTAPAIAIVGATGPDDVLFRRDLGVSAGRALATFVVGDQRRKGAARNAGQIAEQLFAR